MISQRMKQRMRNRKSTDPLSDLLYHDAATSRDTPRATLNEPDKTTCSFTILLLIACLLLAACGAGIPAIRHSAGTVHTGACSGHPVFSTHRRAPAANGHRQPCDLPGVRAHRSRHPLPPQTSVDEDAQGLSRRASSRTCLSQMTLAEKIGQMTQVESDSITPDEVTAYAIGSVLTGGSGAARPNTPEGWLKRSAAYQQAALATRLAIPLIYGVDAVHGLGGLKGATLFPQNIGLGAANDPDLMRRIGRATAEETAATGVRWNFAPVGVAVPQDIRWGRTYESYGEDPALVSVLAVPYIDGLQSAGGSRAFDDAFDDPCDTQALPCRRRHGLGNLNHCEHGSRLPDRPGRRPDRRGDASCGAPGAVPGRRRCRARAIYHGVVSAAGTAKRCTAIVPC